MHVEALFFNVHVCIIPRHAPVQRDCATAGLNVLALVLNRGSAIDKAIVGEVYKCKR